MATEWARQGMTILLHSQQTIFPCFLYRYSFFPLFTPLTLELLISFLILDHCAFGQSCDRSVTSLKVLPYSSKTFSFFLSLAPLGVPPPLLLETALNLTTSLNLVVGNLIMGWVHEVRHNGQFKTIRITRTLIRDNTHDLNDTRGHSFY